MIATKRIRQVGLTVVLGAALAACSSATSSSSSTTGHVGGSQAIQTLSPKAIATSCSLMKTARTEITSAYRQGLTIKSGGHGSVTDFAQAWVKGAQDIVAFVNTAPGLDASARTQVSNGLGTVVSQVQQILKGAGADQMATFRQLTAAMGSTSVAEPPAVAAYVRKHC